MAAGPGTKNLGYGKPASTLTREASQKGPNGSGGRVPMPPMGKVGDKSPQIKRVT